MSNYAWFDDSEDAGRWLSDRFEEIESLKGDEAFAGRLLKELLHGRFGNYSVSGWGLLRTVGDWGAWHAARRIRCGLAAPETDSEWVALWRESDGIGPPRITDPAWEELHEWKDAMLMRQGVGWPEHDFGLEFFMFDEPGSVVYSTPANALTFAYEPEAPSGTYAWLLEGDEVTDTCPVVRSDSVGRLTVVGANFRDFLAGGCRKGWSKSGLSDAGRLALSELRGALALRPWRFPAVHRRRLKKDHLHKAALPADTLIVGSRDN